jgi:heme/copper-type cytochrome/quinol oxidase subunit 3
MLRQSLSLISSRRDLYQAKLVFILFIASLTMFFLATLATYVIIRTQAFQPITREYIALKVPLTFWLSTGLLLVVSYLLERATWHVRRELQPGFLFALRLAFWGGLLFTLIQGVGLCDLLVQHFSASDGSTKAYGMSFTIAFVHALHVLGGLIFMGWVWYQAERGRYDHERHWAVNHCAGYWHFLDVVWVAMLVTFLWTR